MELTHDELAGVVDLFGALTHDELVRAGDELAYKRGATFDDEGAIAVAVTTYHLVAIEYEEDIDRDADDTLFAAGPTAFPTLPAGAEDLPHIFDLDPTTPDRGALAESVEKRFRADAARAVTEGDTDRIGRLLDISYDIEAWAPVDLAGVRDRLDAATE